MIKNIQASLIILVGCLLIGALVFSLTRSNENIQTQNLLKVARSYSATLTGMRNFYQTNIIQNIQNTDAVAVHNFREIDGAIPIPATMLIELTNYLNKNGDDIIFSLVSDYPFPWRADRPLLPFDEEALEALRSSNAEEYYRFYEENDKLFLHYAKPVIMQQGCVDCHNNHPDSPKTNWRKGDIRAVQIFEIPVETSAAMLTKENSIVISAVLILGLTALAALVFLNNKSSSMQIDLMKAAHFDSLTNAMRRPYFQDCYDNQTRDKDYFLAILDVDDFKSYNTNFGHASGDEILMAISKFLQDFVQKAEVVCRYGGEEFLLLIPQNGLGEEVESFFDKIVKSVSDLQIRHGRFVSQATISMGYLELNQNDDLTLVAERADAALRFAKRSGKNRSIYADIEKLRSWGYLDQTYTTNDLSLALQNNELFYAFQPIVDISSREIIALEALIRWRQSDEHIIPPGSFLSQFISCLRDPLNIEYINDTLKASLQRARNAYPNVSSISFNLDPYDLINGFNGNGLIMCLKNHQSDYDIGIEITETSLTRDMDTAEFASALEEVSAAGFLLQMDDFGKEGSSLERLALQRFNRIKTDISLMTGIEHSEIKQKMLSLILELAESVGASVVVEGVETEEQLSVLQKLGVRYAQGYLLGRPE